MPRLIKYTTNSIIDDIPDNSLMIIEQSMIFYFINQRFSNNRDKFICYALTGSAWEYFIDMLKKQDPDSDRKT